MSGLALSRDVVLIAEVTALPLSAGEASLARRQSPFRSL
jgi:hypothetical protein